MILEFKNSISQTAVSNPFLSLDIGGLKYFLQQFKEEKQQKKSPSSLVYTHELQHAGFDSVCTKRVLESNKDLA